ncbi:putative 1-phosphatidylinositol 3-phosphate 5-kinase isoform X2 [Lucilia cuprina]|uniref:putative 1-phosphatidylinositol 3-phosphate 5-kinase isoform X2 n=1 Tax=Lucilia cuprina TaxID=7375 RepID=UPI001F056C27|nr:putative 1-phosphatidylinositol 3-phosphate 5-kinase isoform X2 [Lucilia cuprina]
MSANQNLHSMTKLTEFARDFEEEPETLFGRFVNKIQNAYNQSYNTVNDLSSVNPPQSPTSSASPNTTKSVFYADVNAQPDNSTITRDSSSSSINSNVVYQTKSNNIVGESSSNTADDSSSVGKADTLPMEGHEGRTMVNVLKRMRTMMASKNNDLRNYKDTDLHRFWMPDSKAKECYDCTQKFSTFRRKHHCRLCGQIFCSKCCNQVVPGKIIMCSGELKVCNYCSKIVLSYLRSPNITKDLNSDLQALQQDLTSKLETNNDAEPANLIAEPTRSQLERKVSVGYQEERFAVHQPSISLTMDDRKNILQQSNSLITLHEEMRKVLPPQNCGVELIEFLNTNHKSSNKVQAVAILNAMLDAGFIQPIVTDSEETEFDENLHYRFVSVLPRQALEAINFMEINPTEETLSPQFEQFGIEPHPPKSLDSSFNLKSTRDVELDNSMHTTTSKLLESYCDHEEQLLAQMLRTFQLDLNWAKILNPLCCRAANHFKPEYCTNELMDIRNYVNFKKVPGGKRLECTIVGGVVFSKNVAHKDMATRVEQPEILLLQCPIVYERIEGKFVSISTVLLQEKEYLRNVCARIMSFKPNVVLVHKNVAGVAQDILRSNGITLVLDVKLSVMDRLARTLQCDVLTSIEGNISQPKLGKCDAFYIRNYNDGMGATKTLMFFEKLQSPRGFTCLLRGGSNKELAKVKKVASFLVYARYNWRLEMSFLLDEFAEPLTPKPPIFDSKETSPADENANINESNLDISQLNNDEDEEVPQLRSAFTTSSNKTRPVVAERKSEEKILTTATDVSADFTDPLRSAESKISPDNSHNLQLAVEHRYDNRFRSALSSTILSVSPFLTFPLPYLETEQGRKCPLRILFPAELYYSKLWSNANSSNSANYNYERLESAEIIPTDVEQLELNPSHEFLKLKITTPIDNREIQTLLAEFRAYGGRYPKRPRLFKFLKGRKEVKSQMSQKVQEENVYKDALDIENHQRLPVLFCSFFFNPKGASSFCAPPTLLDMKFYGQQDIMLGQFLQRYCCRLSSICTRCNLPMLGHTRRYVHSMGCVKVFLSEDNTKSDLNSIYFTAWCSICNEVTPSVPLSETTKCLSLAKYLELRFHGHAYKKRSVADENGLGAKTQCQHSLHRDYVHQFSYRGVAAKFQYTPLETWEIALPLLTLNLHPSKAFSRFEVLEEVKNFSMKGHEVYTRIHERIADLATEDENSPLVSSLKTILSKDQFIFKQHVEIIQTLLTENKASPYDINDALLMSKRVLAESIEQWGPRLHEMAVAQKLAAKQGHDSAHHQAVDAGMICTEDLRSEHSDISPTTTHTPDTPRLLGNEDSLDTTSNTNETPTSATDKSSIDSHFVMPSVATTTVPPSSDKKTIKKMLTQLLPSTGPVNLLQSPFSNLEHYTLPLGAFPMVVHDHDFSSIIAYCLTSQEYKRILSVLATQQNAADTTSISSNSGVNVNPSPHVKRKSQESYDADDGKENNTPPPSAATSNNNQEEERSKTKTSNSHIEISFQDNNTQFTCKMYFAREFDQMRARTIKAPKLDKSLYREIEQSKKREELKVSQSKNGPEIELVRKPSDAGQINTIASDYKWENYSSNSNNNASNKDDNSRGQVDATEECRYYFARSLCSSVQWEAKGGKSGSRFCKTSDDRFVLKEMTKSDINSFENFAPNYFDYISKCQQQNQPTLLAKIFGVFKVTIKKKDSFVEKSLLVMENLFYECDIKNKFDLKGSERNRLVDPMNQQQGDIVLLDENFVQMSWLKPLYILTHSKVVLKDAINRDACFLEKNQVMDYSLLVGLDENNGVLVLGIIDYIRTFTFDKKVESFVKQTGILGGMGKLPTIIPPERYRLRFADAMDRYFYTVPDRWEGLSKI